MLAYIVEEHADGNLTLFVPLGSAPGVGTIQIVGKGKVERLDASMMDTLGCLFNWGSGAEALLKKRARRWAPSLKSLSYYCSRLPF